MQLAAQFEQDGDLTAAASVLERYLIVDADAVGPRAEYAMLLCRLDDLQAGRFERAKLASIPADADVLRLVDGVCGTETVAASRAGKGSTGP